MIKALALSLIVGLLVGAIYGLLQVRSPAPPYVALVGLLGILLGESAVQTARSWFAPVAAVQDLSEPTTGGRP